MLLGNRAQVSAEAVCTLNHGDASPVPKLLPTLKITNIKQTHKHRTLRFESVKKSKLMAIHICVLEAEADLDTYQTDSSAGSISDVFCRLTGQKNEPFNHHGLLLE